MSLRLLQACVLFRLLLRQVATVLSLPFCREAMQFLWNERQHRSFRTAVHLCQFGTSIPSMGTCDSKLYAATPESALNQAKCCSCVVKGGDECGRSLRGALSSAMTPRPMMRAAKMGASHLPRLGLLRQLLRPRAIPWTLRYAIPLNAGSHGGDLHASMHPGHAAGVRACDTPSCQRASFTVIEQCLF